MKSTGQSLFDEVVRKMRLVESDYFDLEYTDVHGATVSTASANRYNLIQQPRRIPTAPRLI